jgi:prepilin-type N-terminal cleavage/methylation domain-containing protein
MECNVTSTKLKGARAFTLTEVLVGIAIGGVILAILGQLVMFTGRSFAALANYTELDRRSRNALDQMVYKIRQANELTAFTTNRLTFTYQATNTLVYEYSPSDRTLTESLAGNTKVLLTGCDLCAFSIFQRNTAAGSYDQFPATLTNSAAKLVQLNWTCSRTVLGLRLNTESVQSAKIVIRNQ